MPESVFTERAVVQPEKKQNFYISREKILARSTDKIGRLFLEKKFYSNKWKADTEAPYFKKDGKTIYEINIEERNKKTPQSLTLKYEKSPSAQPDKRELTTIQLNVDQATKIGLRKNQYGKWEYFRDTMGPQDIQLSSEEILLLNRHLHELKLSLNWEKMIDILDPTSTFKTIAPALMAVSTIVGGVYLNQNISAINAHITDYLQKGNLVQQKDHTITQAKEKKPSYIINRLSPSNEKMFQDEALAVRNNFYQPENNMLVMRTLGLVDDLNMTTRFFSQSQLKNGRDFSNTVGKYLTYSQDGNGRYRWRTYIDGQPEKKLVKPLWQMLKTIREDKNPQSQKNYFRMLDAFLHFKGQSITSPEKIMIQFGLEGNLDFVNGKDLWQNYWNIGPDNFNKGPIKGFWASSNTVIPGEVLVTDFGQVGIIMNVTKENKVTVLFIDAKGQARRVVYDESNFPQAIVFGNTMK
ncbi:MAG: hypothetical protein WC741_03565 [Patescibacteria group bacterium]|jgi:hypothetical protein